MEGALITGAKRRGCQLKIGAPEGPWSRLGRIEEHGDFVHAVASATEPGRPVGGKRGEIKSGMSGASRVRFLKLLSRVRPQAETGRVPVLVTLTLPGEWDWSWGWCGDRAESAIRWLEGEVGAAVVWRREYQARGAPHWHLVTWVRQREVEVVLARLRQALPSYWSRLFPEMTGEGAGHHLEHGSYVETARTVGAWRGYLAGSWVGDLSKGAQSVAPANADFVGRAWGVRGRRELELVRVRIRFCSFGRAQAAISYIDRAVRAVAPVRSTWRLTGTARPAIVEQVRSAFFPS